MSVPASGPLSCDGARTCGVPETSRRTDSRSFSHGTENAVLAAHGPTPARTTRTVEDGIPTRSVGTRVEALHEVVSRVPRFLYMFSIECGGLFCGRRSA